MNVRDAEHLDRFECSLEQFKFSIQHNVELTEESECSTSNIHPILSIASCGKKKHVRLQDSMDGAQLLYSQK